MAQAERGLGVTEALAAPIQPPSMAQPKIARAAEQKGLSLRFDSEDALLALVAQRRVQVYVWVVDAAWRLVSERGALRFAPADRPRRFHQMTPDTVPAILVRAIDQATPAVRHHTPSWGVVLPPVIAHQVKALIDGHANGTLLIQADGRVRLQRAG